MTRLQHYFHSLLVISLLSACGHSTDKVCTNDFEQMTAWATNPSVIQGTGHSGFYFSTTDSNIEFSATFTRKISELGDKPIKRATISAWLRPIESEANAGLILSIERPGKILLYYSIDTRNTLMRINEWTQLSGKINFPAGIERDDMVKVYVWNHSKKRMDVDDFNIHFQY